MPEENLGPLTPAEEIQLCLNCTRPRCVDCLSHLKPGRAKANREARRQKVKELREEGRTIADIAVLVGASRQTVGDILRDLGMSTSDVRMTRVTRDG